jgi:hypothetical protein
MTTMKLKKPKFAAVQDLTVFDWLHAVSIGAAGVITDVLLHAHLSPTSETFVVLTTVLGILGVFNQTASPEPSATPPAATPPSA